MDDYALVLNAGSSSLKFCVYRRPDASLAARGARPDRGHRHVAAIHREKRRRARRSPTSSWTRSVTRRPHGARRARRLAALAAIGGARIVGVGHRVVHGGPRFAGPIVVTPQVLDDLRELMPLAPLHQPHNLAAIEAVFERLPDVPQVACFDTSFHRGQPAGRRAGAAAARDLRRRRAAVRVPRAVVRVHRVGPAEGRAGDRRRTRDRRAPRQRREPVRAEERQEHRQHARLHRARRTVHGHAARAPSIPA